MSNTSALWQKLYWSTLAAHCDKDGNQPHECIVVTRIINLICGFYNERFDHMTALWQTIFEHILSFAIFFFRPPFDELYHWLEAIILHLDVAAPLPLVLQSNTKPEVDECTGVNGCKEVNGCKGHSNNLPISLSEELKITLEKDIKPTAFQGSMSMDTFNKRGECILWDTTNTTTTCPTAFKGSTSKDKLNQRRDIQWNTATTAAFQGSNSKDALNEKGEGTHWDTTTTACPFGGMPSSSFLPLSSDSSPDAAVQEYRQCEPMSMSEDDDLL